MGTSKFIAKLQCGHDVYFDPQPKPGDTLYCRRCLNWFPIMAANQEWSIRCQDCAMSRPYGTDKDRAMRVGNRHVHKKPGHTVRLLQGMTVVDTISSEHPVLPLHIRWASENPNHQSSLRSLSKRDRS